MGLKEIRGQERAVEILKRAVEQGKLAHAYLFLGPPGTGKYKTALELARDLNCEAMGSQACGSCSSCIKIGRSIHPDVMQIEKGDGSTRISIDRIRQIQQRLSLKPYEARYKIAIIRDAQDMSEEASNCLLKLLEEPTPDTLLILTSENQNMLASTIVSRCQIVRFRPLNIDEVKDILIEDFNIEEDKARFLSAMSGTDASKALMLRDKDAAAWKNSVIDEFCRSGCRIDDGNITPEKNRSMQIEAMDILLGFYRDVLIYKFTGDRELIINIDRLDDISALAGSSDAESIEKAVEDIEEARVSMASSANIKLTLSVLKEKLISQG